MIKSLTAYRDSAGVLYTSLEEVQTAERRAMYADVLKAGTAANPQLARLDPALFVDLCMMAGKEIGIVANDEMKPKGGAEVKVVVHHDGGVLGAASLPTPGVSALLAAAAASRRSGEGPSAYARARQRVLEEQAVALATRAASVVPGGPEPKTSTGEPMDLAHKRAPTFPDVSMHPEVIGSASTRTIMDDLPFPREAIAKPGVFETAEKLTPEAPAKKPEPIPDLVSTKTPPFGIPANPMAGTPVKGFEPEAFVADVAARRAEGMEPRERLVTAHHPAFSAPYGSSAETAVNNPDGKVWPKHPLETDSFEDTLVAEILSDAPVPAGRY